MESYSTSKRQGRNFFDLDFEGASIFNIGDMCVEGCGFCSEVGLEVPNPPATPTVPPTMLSTETCKDDPDYMFDLGNGSNQNCAWLTKNSAKTYISIEKNCVRGHVKEACGLSCNYCPPCKDNASFIFDHYKSMNCCGWNTVNADRYLALRKVLLPRRREARCFRYWK